ncbi:MAG: copper chaperone PCu(A)C [Chloroflexota bacterium]
MASQWMTRERAHAAHPLRLLGGFLGLLLVLLVSALIGAYAARLFSVAARPAHAQALYVIDEPWARPGGQGGTSAAYMVLRNADTVEHTLRGAVSQAARNAELHRSYMDQGVMRMEPVEGLVIPPGGAATLAPGGFHVMLLDLQADLAEGGEIQLTLLLDTDQELTLAVPVRSGR